MTALVSVFGYIEQHEALQGGGEVADADDAPPSVDTANSGLISPLHYVDVYEYERSNTSDSRHNVTKIPR